MSRQILATSLTSMRPFLLFTACVLCTTAGCATLARQALAPPVVEVKDVTVAAIGLTGGTLNVTLAVANPNEFRIDATRVTYRFFVDTAQIVSGEVDELLTLESRGATALVLPVSFGYRELGIAMREYAATGALQYRVLGEFTLKTPFGNITRPYAGTGRVQGLP